MDKIPMVEFAINSSISKSTRYVPTLQGILDQVPITLKPGVREFANQVHRYLMEAHDSVIAAQVRQTFHANKQRWEEPLYNPGDRVWLLAENLMMLKGHVWKLMPKFTRPFVVQQADQDHSNYMLELPPEMVAC